MSKSPPDHFSSYSRASAAPVGPPSLRSSSRGGFTGHGAEPRSLQPRQTTSPQDSPHAGNITIYKREELRNAGWPPTALPPASLGRPPYGSIPIERYGPLPWPIVNIIPPRAPVASTYGESMYSAYGPTTYVLTPLSDIPSVAFPTSHSSLTATASRVLTGFAPTGYPAPPAAWSAPVYYLPRDYNATLPQQDYMDAVQLERMRHSDVSHGAFASSSVPFPAQPGPSPALASTQPGTPPTPRSPSPSHVKSSSTSKVSKPTPNRKRESPNDNKKNNKSSSASSTARRLSNERSSNTRRGTKYQNDAFPMKLHRLLRNLEESRQTHIAGFSKDGKSFYIRNKVEFEAALPTVFRHGKFLSFKRLLYMYGFTCIRVSSTERGEFRREKC